MTSRDPFTVIVAFWIMFCGLALIALGFIPEEQMPYFTVFVAGVGVTLIFMAIWVSDK